MQRRRTVVLRQERCQGCRDGPGGLLLPAQRFRAALLDTLRFDHSHLPDGKAAIASRVAADVGPCAPFRRTFGWMVILSMALPGFRGVTIWPSPQLVSQQALGPGGRKRWIPATTVYHTRS